MSITRDEVAHLARLSRLALTEDELDHFAGQLDVIIAAVARVQEVAADGIPPTTHAVPVTNVFREDVIVPPLGRGSRRSIRRPRPSRAGSASRASWRRTDHEQRADQDDGGRDRGAGRGAVRCRRSRSPRAHLDRIEAVDERVHAFLHVAADGALAAARAVDDQRARRRAARPAGRGAAGAEGRVHHRGHAHDLRIAHPGGLAAALRRDRHPAAAATPGSSFSARPTWTSSRWARPPRTRRSARRTTPGTSAGCPAARPAARPRRSPRSRRRWASAPTPADRSASPPRSAGSSASSRPTAAPPGTAWSRSPPRWTRQGRWPAPCSTRRCCTRSCPGTTRATRPRSTRRCRPWSPRPGRPTSAGCASAW